MIAVLMANIPPQWQWITAAAIVLSLVLSLVGLGVIRGQGRLSSLLWQADDQWSLILASGKQLSATLRRDSFIGASILILNFSLEGSRGGRSVVLLPNMVERALYRSLRARLMMHRCTH